MNAKHPPSMMFCARCMAWMDLELNHLRRHLFPGFRLVSVKRGDTQRRPTLRGGWPQNGRRGKKEPPDCSRRAPSATVG